MWDEFFFLVKIIGNFNVRFFNYWIYFIILFMLEDYLRVLIKGFKIKVMGIEFLKMILNFVNVVVDKKIVEMKKLLIFENEKL